MSLPYTYGQKLAAEPWSPLKVGLIHGALAALPGAALGGAAGYLTAPEDAAEGDRRVRAALGASLGGAMTGLPGGALSAGAQTLHADEYNRARAMLASLDGTETGFAKALGDYHRQNLPNYPTTWLGDKGLRGLLRLG